MTNAQKAVIGYILLTGDKSKQKEILERLSLDFFTGMGRRIVQAMFVKAKEKHPIDLLGLCSAFSNNTEVEDVLYYCVASANTISSVESALIELLNEYKTTAIESLAQSPSLDAAAQKLKDINNKRLLIEGSKSKSPIDIILDSIKEQEESGLDIYNLPKTGFSNIDKYFKGFMPQELVTIGGYTGVGKSSFMFSLISNLAFKHKTLIINLELSNQVMAARMLANISKIPFHLAFSLGNTQTQDNIDRFGFRNALNNGFHKLAEMNLSMVDSVYNLNGILSKIRFEAKFGLRFVVIDYVQIIRLDTSKKDMRLDMIEITRELKLLAKELNITIIILAQLGRGSLTKTEPDTSDLKESGSIAEDSDTVFLLYKDKNNKRFLKIAKYRMFATFGTAHLCFDNETQSYF